MTRLHAFSRDQLLASARGELFGPDKGRLPNDPMLMFDRITTINADGGEHGKGYVEAQLRLHDRLVDLYQTQASHTPDRELATFAITSLVGIQKDRDALRQAADRFGIETSPGGQAIQYGDPTKAR